MFVDVAKITIKAGKGGDGAVSFHREKFVAAGGPDGGDGGRGGNVVFVADDNLSTLMDFRYKRKYAAQPGENGGASRCSGKNAPDLVIKVPRGTLIKDAKSGAIMADISGDEPVIVAKGGRGGWGNSHFATPTRQIPKFAKPGLPGQEYEIRLELKLIADVGLIGFPNVGKSTLISVISAAKPKIANYHFTTLSPVLGVVKVGPEQSFVAADIPGLIEGASEGIGLGHDFLRHVERCRLLLHVVDVSGCEGRDPVEDFEKINSELQNFSAELSQRPQIVLGNKCDIATEEQVEAFRQYVESKGLVFLPISAATNQGLKPLPGMVWERLQELPPVQRFEPDFVPEQPVAGERRYTITKTDEHEFTIDAPWLERILSGSDVEDYESLQYFQRQLDESGILRDLVAQGVEEEDTIKIGEYEFDYIF
ncbi:MAG: GTPase ObgE [Candidatus Fournierella pullistercoris]|uniref:GTPase Obg n=1 Tax=Candidatus Allofournierella pullistercoris TaxID=2838597 RepID=A0A948T214_9FIRM|nr:GTPase ObgE [Candidatus Fournierella pullistercoris]